MTPVSDFCRRVRPECRVRRRRIVVRSRGFTLLEVMIAMAILAITLVALYQSQSQSISMASDSRFLTTASLLAQSRMAEFDAVDPRGVVSANGDFGDDYPGYTWRLEVGVGGGAPAPQEVHAHGDAGPDGDAQRLPADPLQGGHLDERYKGVSR